MRESLSINRQVRSLCAVLHSPKAQNEVYNEAIFGIYRQVKSLNSEGVEVADVGKTNSNPAVVAELQRKLEHAQRMLQQADVTSERKTGQPWSSVLNPFLLVSCPSSFLFSVTHSQLPLSLLTVPFKAPGVCGLSCVVLLLGVMVSSFPSMRP